MERNQIPASIRAAVLDRDEYTCQYCGRKAPDVTLHIDHIIPVSKGGNNHIDNLVTACIDCNLGKSDNIIHGNKELIARAKAACKIPGFDAIKDHKSWRENHSAVSFRLTDSEVTAIDSLASALGKNRTGLIKLIARLCINECGVEDMASILKKAESGTAYSMKTLSEKELQSKNRYLKSIHNYDMLSEEYDKRAKLREEWDNKFYSALRESVDRNRERIEKTKKQDELCDKALESYESEIMRIKKMGLCALLLAQSKAMTRKKALDAISELRRASYYEYHKCLTKYLLCFNSNNDVEGD